MKASDSFSEIAKALVQARTKVENLYKSGKSYSNKYIPLDDVVDHLKAVLPALGLGYIQLPDGGTEHTIGLTTRVFHSSGEWIEASAEFALTNMKSVNVSQGAGSAISYFRRYALCAAFGIVGEDDPENGWKPDTTPGIPENDDVEKGKLMIQILNKRGKNGKKFFSEADLQKFRALRDKDGIDEALKQAELALEAFEAADD